MDTIKTLASSYFSNYAGMMFRKEKSLEFFAKYSDRKMDFFKGLWANSKEYKRHKRDTYRYYDRNTTISH